MLDRSSLRLNRAAGLRTLKPLSLEGCGGCDIHSAEAFLSTTMASPRAWPVRQYTQPVPGQYFGGCKVLAANAVTTIHCPCLPWRAYNWHILMA
jgi:hypothetical protein